MEIGSLLQRPAAALPSRRQPSEDAFASGEMIRQQTAPASAPALRVIQEVADAESMLLRSRRNQEAELQRQEEYDLRSRRALSAYGALEQTAERDYVHSLMGIDEFV